jgi:hypothetical protein
MIQYCDPKSNHDLCVTKSLLLNGLHFTENNKTNKMFTYKDLYMLIFHSIRYDTYILYWITFLFVILYLSNSSSILRSCIDYSSFILYSIFLSGLFPFHSTFHFPVWIIPLCSTFFSLTNINTNFNKKEFG